MGFTSNLMKMNKILTVQNEALKAQLDKAVKDNDLYRKAVMEITQLEPVTIDGVTFVQFDKVVKIFTDNLKNL